MTFKKAAKHFVNRFGNYDAVFKNKYKSYISKWKSGGLVSEKKMKEILKKAGYKLNEYWEPPK